MKASGPPPRSPTSDTKHGDLPAQHEAALMERLARARDAWPRVNVSPERFWAHWEGQALEHTHVEDLYLAFACVERDPEALKQLRELLAKTLPAVRAVDPSDAFVQEVEQQVLERLIVPREGRAPRIAEYRGRGPLEHWLRAVAARVALNHRRTLRRVPEISTGDALLDVAAPNRDPGLELLKARHRGQLSEAIERALQGLSRQERNVLRLHFVEGMSLSQIGAVYHANKSTISRWISRALESLLQRVRADLQALGIESGDVGSLLLDLGSRLDLSLSSALRLESSVTLRK